LCGSGFKVHAKPHAFGSTNAGDKLSKRRSWEITEFLNSRF
jgi:hypothetical protein